MDNWQYPEIETPENREDYISLGKKLRQLFREWSSKTWTDIKEEDGIKLSEFYLDNSSIPVLKITKIFKNVKPERLIDLNFNCTFDQKKSTNPDLIDYKIIDNPDTNRVVAYSQYSAPFGVSNREFLYFQELWQNNGVSMIITQSVNIKKFPFSPSYVRGIITSFYVIDEVAEGTRFSMINHVDPKGWIPGFIINSYKEKEMTKMRTIETLVKE